MKKITKKEVAICEDQLLRALHYLDELNIHYAFVIEGHEKLWHNTTDRHALDILREFIEISDKVRELTVEDAAMKLTALKPLE